MHNAEAHESGPREKSMGTRGSFGDWWNRVALVCRYDLKASADHPHMRMRWRARAGRVCDYAKETCSYLLALVPRPPNAEELGT